MNKSLVSFAFQNPILEHLVGVLEAFDRRQPDLLRVITYHRIIEEGEDSLFSPGLTVRLPVFQQQVAYLSRNFRVLHIHELLQFARSGAELPERSLLITFDDAYQDFADLAWPILRQYALPVTLFVPTAFPGSPGKVFWWDWLSLAFERTICREELVTPAGRFSMAESHQRLNAFKRHRDYLKGIPNAELPGMVESICAWLGVPQDGTRILSWDALRELTGEGVALGAHTRTHPLMNRISEEEMRQEVQGSIEDLRRETGQSLPVFAYPGGELDDVAVQVLKESGIELGFTTRRGINDFSSVDHLRISRINIGQRTSLAVLRGQLLARTRSLYR